MREDRRVASRADRGVRRAGGQRVCPLRLDLTGTETRARRRGVGSSGSASGVEPLSTTVCRCPNAGWRCRCWRTGRSTVPVEQLRLLEIQATTAWWNPVPGSSSSPRRDNLGSEHCGAPTSPTARRRYREGRMVVRRQRKTHRPSRARGARLTSRRRRESFVVGESRIRAWPSCPSVS
jgi:hypothetical protein